MNGLAYALALVTGLGLAQCLAGWILVARFAARATTPPARLPPVTILKPLCGDEPLLEEALASCCRQSYSDFQIVFGVQDRADPALTVAQRLRDRFPQCDIAIVVDDTPHGPNRKVANLINMLPSARHDVLVISDSDLHVRPDYLEHLVAALEVPGTGLVTAVYIGVGARRVGPAWLGVTHISHTFLPGVLVARTMGRQDCLGSTVMLRRQVLEDIGGLQPLVTQLAEDNGGHCARSLLPRIVAARTSLGPDYPRVGADSPCCLDIPIPVVLGRHGLLAFRRRPLVGRPVRLCLGNSGNFRARNRLQPSSQARTTRIRGAILAASAARRAIGCRDHCELLGQ